MRLIDANALKEYCMRASKSDDDFRRVSLATLASVIDAQPTAYDVDKVVEQLEETKAYMLYENMNADVKWFNKAIEIVKGGGTDEE
jgi:hypothetical protein